VELTFNGGKTWVRADMKKPLIPSKKTPASGRGLRSSSDESSPYSWVFWEYDFRPPKPGPYEIAVRATDRIGRGQTDFIARPFPDGTSGLHSVVTFVE
jgi:hypothetical protein